MLNIEAKNNGQEPVIYPKPSAEIRKMIREYEKYLKERELKRGQKNNIN